MTMRSVRPFERSLGPLSAMRRDMDRLLGSLAPVWTSASAADDGFLSPSVDIAETEKGIELTAELPGIEPKDIDISIADDVLTLRADRTVQREEGGKDKRYHVVERASGTYLRRFQLPFEIDADKVEATFDKGVVTVQVPRAANAARQARRIAVKTAA